jgi:hypothetical protein
MNQKVGPLKGKQDWQTIQKKEERGRKYKLIKLEMWKEISQ